MGTPIQNEDAWRPPRRRKLVKALFAFVVIVALVGVVVAVMPESTQPDGAKNGSDFSAPKPENDDGDDDQPESEPDPDPEPEPDPAPRSYRFQGDGDNLTENFSTQNRLLRFDIQHTGTGFFTVDLHDETGEGSQTLIDEFGQYDGTRYFTPPPGEYRLEIQAGGPWQIDLEQPSPEEGEAPPFAWQGERDHASPAIDLDAGPVTINLTHQATGSFTVRLLDEHGEHIETLVDTWGTHAGSYNVTIPQQGFYVLDIQAGGAWRVEVTQ